MCCSLENKQSFGLSGLFLSKKNGIKQIHEVKFVKFANRSKWWRLGLGCLDFSMGLVISSDLGTNLCYGSVRSCMIRSMWLRVRNGSWLVQSLGGGFDLNLFFSTQLKHFIKQKHKIYIKATDTNFSKSWFDSSILIGFQFIALAGMIHPRTILQSDLYCIQWD